MYSPSRTTDLSRPRLRALAEWIRGDLDLRVARDGPDILRPDDVLTLHETFVALSLATGTTAGDLRTTGIHRALNDIAGVATRWPGVLCDDCDRIILLWTVKFGPFSELRPAIYGRGGKLEGIASVDEHDREEDTAQAMVKVLPPEGPSETIPQICWWIDTLFAHHAGIIGLEAVDGGTTFNREGAYALVLEGKGEVEVSSAGSFTYLVPHGDKGKFRLTAATLKSRNPIRVLRAHKFSSIRGPKVGVRFEGLFTVKGWSIRLAGRNDTFVGDWKEGDTMFEVKFEREDDGISLDKITKRPTITEIDEYVEYKRLRKLHSKDRHKVPGSNTPRPINTSEQFVSQVSPSVLSRYPGEITGLPKMLLKAPSITTSKSIFKHPHLDSPAYPSNESDFVSPTTIPVTNYFPLISSKSSPAPIHPSLRPHRPGRAGSSTSGCSNSSSRARNPIANSVHTAHTNSTTQVTAPWTSPLPPTPTSSTIKDKSPDPTHSRNASLHSRRHARRNATTPIHPSQYRTQHLIHILTPIPSP
ncbi:hypothetical protein GQ44DRAFT_755702 [Phaeosphaeriaceae sp. PMI808]|nr:hypothetical protein GQ44DRAFT_755702 [Phaeosphaeriaceae sp. PMI808]